MKLNVIRSLTMRAKTEGVAETTQELRGLQEAHEQAAEQFGKTKSQLSLSEVMKRAEKRFNKALNLSKRKSR